MLGASWWNQTLLDPLTVVPVVLSFLVGWRVGFPATVVALVALAFGSTAGLFGVGGLDVGVHRPGVGHGASDAFAQPPVRSARAAGARARGRARGVAAREAVRYERARIARDLHDIVAHNLSLIVVQAGAGRRASPERPEVLSESLRHIEAGAQSAREEIDQLVGLLGDDARDGGADGGLRRLDALLRGAATSGLWIACSDAGSRDQVAPELAEVAYRVTQEGIANALKHAPRLVNPGRGGGHQRGAIPYRREHGADRYGRSIGERRRPLRPRRAARADRGAPGDAGRPADPNRRMAARGAPAIAGATAGRLNAPDAHRAVAEPVRKGDTESREHDRKACAR